MPPAMSRGRSCMPTAAGSPPTDDSHRLECSKRVTPMPRGSTITRRELLAGAGAGAAALLLDSRSTGAQPANRPVVFTNTTVVTVDAVQDDVALAVSGDKIAAIGPNDAVVRNYPNADVYDGRGKALFPGLVNCHAHLAATLERGYNEDFGFPNSARPAI